MLNYLSVIPLALLSSGWIFYYFLWLASGIRFSHAGKSVATTELPAWFFCQKILYEQAGLTA